MDFIKNFSGDNKAEAQGQGQGQQQGQQQGGGENAQNTQTSGSSGGFLGGLTDKFNSAAGGGKESEKNEDYLDKGMVPWLTSTRSSP